MSDISWALTFKVTGALPGCEPKIKPLIGASG